jgi:hypothetical protein
MPYIQFVFKNINIITRKNSININKKIKKGGIFLSFIFLL